MELQLEIWTNINAAFFYLEVPVLNENETKKIYRSIWPPLWAGFIKFCTLLVKL